MSSGCSCDNCSVCEPAGGRGEVSTEPQDMVAELACDECGGTMTWGVTDHALHREGRVLLIRHIPAFVCRQCGNAYYELVQTRHLGRQFDRFLTRAVSCRVEEYEESDLNNE